MDAFTRADDATTLPAQQQLRCVRSSGGSVCTRTPAVIRAAVRAMVEEPFFSLLPGCMGWWWWFGSTGAGLGLVQHFGENGVRLGERVRAGLLGWRSGL